MEEITLKQWLDSDNKGPVDGKYEAGQAVCLTTHMVGHVDGRLHRHCCVPCEMDSPSNTGSAYFILDQADADSLEQRGQL